MKNTNQKVPMREKIGYSLGDSSANFVFQIMMVFQMGFYTDVFGISAVAAGSVLLLARVFDAFVDPVVGILSDRTNTKWGKYRPWILYTALPFGLMFVLAFTTPDFDEKGKFIYAAVTYTLLMTLYSMMNTPYSALHGVMTSNIKERTSISSIRFIFAMGAAFVVQGLTLPLVNKFGQGDDQKGWMMATGLFAVVAIIFLIITAVSTKERITPPPGQKTPIKEDLKDIFSNGPWKSMFILTLFLFTTLSMWGSSSFYFFSYYMDKQAIYDFLQMFGLAQTDVINNGVWFKIMDAFGLVVKGDQGNAFNVGFSFFNMVGQLVTIIGVITLSQFLSNRFGKKSTFMVGLFLTAVFTAMFYIVPPKSVGLAFTLNILKSIAYAPTIPLLWAMMGDVADFSEWKNNRRATGFVFAGIVFGLKAGLGVGGWLLGLVLNAFGFVANVVQTETAIHGIRLSVSIIPALIFMIGVIALYFYPITKKFNEEIQEELAVRRSKFSD